MSNNKIIEKIFIKGNLKLLSPISIGNGIEESTDNDFIRDSYGQIFIPGTSIAGAVRNYLEELYSDDKNEALKSFFGYTNSDEGSQSSIFFYDAHLIENGTVVVRDGIALEEFLKVTKDTAKYDYEVAERDNIFSFKLEIEIRKKYIDYKEDFNVFIKNIINGINEGVILFGSKTNRGLGKVIIEDINALVFNFENKGTLERYLEFNWENDFSIGDSNEYRLGKELINFDSLKTSFGDFTKIQVPLEVKDTLFIRDYSLSNDDVDAEQLNFNERYIIPGTTWSGAFRHRIFITLYDLFGETKAKKVLKALFGEKSDNKQDEGMQSRIRFEESISNEKVKLHEIRRTKIDRFTGGACDKGLFESRVAVGGKTELNIWIKNAKDYEIALILMGIYDLVQGFLSIGGETSVGRGILSTSDKLILDKELIKINGISLTEDVSKKYLKSLKDI